MGKKITQMTLAAGMLSSTLVLNSGIYAFAEPSNNLEQSEIKNNNTTNTNTNDENKMVETDSGFMTQSEAEKAHDINSNSTSDGNNSNDNSNESINNGTEEGNSVSTNTTQTEGQTDTSNTDNQNLTNEESQDTTMGGKFVNTKDMDPNAPDVVAQYAVSIDAESGEILYQKNANVQAYPASITKIMTAMLLMENATPKDKIEMTKVCVQKERSGSQAFHDEGEILSRDTALYAMLVTSANDIACSIGEHISGSEEEFGKLMTERAKKAGAVNTVFHNASGLNDTEHLTTAYDMAMITREAIKHKEVLKAMGTKQFKEVSNLKETDLKNESKIHDDPNALGGKTGFTSDAGNTLVKVVELDGKRIISVVMKTNKSNEYTDSDKISKYAATKINKKKVYSKDKFSKKVTFLGEKVKVGLDDDVYVNEVNGKSSKYTYKIDLDDSKEDVIRKDGLEKGDVIGKIEILRNGEKIKVVNAVSESSIAFDNDSSKNGGIPFNAKVILAILIPIFGYAGFVVYYNRKMMLNRRKRK